MGTTVGVVGAMGLMAEAALHDLGRNPAVSRVVAADLRLGRRRQVAARLPNRRKFKFTEIDLRRTADSARALRGTDVLINAAWYELNLEAMDLALALKAHYVDLGGLYHMTLKQLKKSPEFARARRVAVLGCGSTPGITNMMVADMARSFDRIDAVDIFDASVDPSFGSSFLPPFSIRTMLDEYLMPAPILEKGKIVAAAAHSRAEGLEFKAPIGRCSAGAVIHSEAATLPAFLKDKGVRDLAFKIAYPAGVKEQLALLVSMGMADAKPVKVGAQMVSPRAFVTALAQASAGTPSGAPRDFEVLRVRMAGVRGRDCVVERDCEIRPTRLLSAGAMGVGYAASIAAHLLAAGRTLLPGGAAAPERVFAPEYFFAELGMRKVFRMFEKEGRGVKARSVETAGGRP
ncbi:MAG: saccharopine dehydrogenase NADP-binding domain-containing protein [Elusimicrobia bacterium]|nr:saccharopine dehydrogenase NADP-binding domain-containing protein [Elusimicrobiota bacterium]